MRSEFGVSDGEWYEREIVVWEAAKPLLTVNGIKPGKCEVVRIPRALCAVSLLGRLAVRLAYIGPRLEEKKPSPSLRAGYRPDAARRPPKRRPVGRTPNLGRFE